MSFLEIPEWAKEEGIIWVVYPITPDGEWWKIISYAELSIAWEAN